MAYWLLKTEPETYSFEDLERDGKTIWDGVRNYQARNNLRAMEEGDSCLIYHSVGPRELVGVARVSRAAFPDPTTEDERWLAVELRPVERLPRPVSLAEVKADTALSELALVRHSRLSVAPVTAREWKRLLEIAGRGPNPRPGTAQGSGRARRS